jgi:hypothetical protein
MFEKKFEKIEAIFYKPNTKRQENLNERIWFWFKILLVERRFGKRSYHYPK